MFSECEGVAAWTWWKHAEAAHNQEAKKEINEVLGHDIPFDTPKPTRLIKRILQIATSPGDLVLGSFAGSGTTGHVVLKMNATDRRLGLRPDHGPADILSAEREEAGQDARADADGPEAHPPGHPFILVERDPAIAKRHAVLKMNATDRRLGLRPDHGPADILSAEREEAGQDALADADGPEAHPPGHRFIVVERDTAIAMTITTERVKRVAEGYTNTKGEAVPGLGGGFRYCQLGEPLFEEAGQIRPTVKFGELARHV